jgi:hypothetical protein
LKNQYFPEEFFFNFEMQKNDIIQRVLLPFLVNNSISKRRRKVGARFYRDRSRVFEDIDNLREKDFRRLFRLTRTAFNWLLREITPFIKGEDSSILSQKMKERQILPKTKLAATLRCLAGVRYLYGTRNFIRDLFS